MGFLSGLLGNASEIDVEGIEADFNRFLTDGELIDKAFKVAKDLLVFTNRRLILTDKQGLTGKRVSLHSIPYISIQRFATETAGRFDGDAVLQIWVTGLAEPLVFEFKRGMVVVDVQRLLAGYVC